MRNERKEGETLLEYFTRVTRDRKDMELSYEEWQKILIGENKYSSENCRKAYYIVYPLLEILSKEEQERIIKNLTEKDDIDKKIQAYEEAKLDYEKEKIRYQDQKREFRKYLREDGRLEHMVDTMCAAIQGLEPIEFPNYGVRTTGECEGLCLWSDWHTGAKFKNYFAEYNTDIEKARVQELVEKTTQYAMTHGIDVLTISLLGDNAGEGLIHLGSRVEAEEDIISQLMTYCEILSQALNELSKTFYIKIRNTVGNHNRVVANKKESLDKENLERLIPFYLEARLQGNPNIEILSSDISDDMDLFEILGSKIVAVHGDKDKPETCLSKISGMLKIFPDYVVMGHYHNGKELSNYDMEVIVNGSLKGTDSYCQGLRLSGKPMQKFIVFNKEGRLCTYNINFSK